MLSRRSLTSLVILLLCPVASVAQLPKRLERCLSIPTLAQEIRDTQREVEPKKLTLHVARIEFDRNSGIPQEIQDEILKNELGQTLEEDADSDYLKNAASEIAEVHVRESLQKAGYFRVLSETELTVLKRDGPKIDVVAHVRAELGDQYRIGEIKLEPFDPEVQLLYSAESLREKIPLKRGDILDLDKIRRGLRDLASMYGEDGYIDFTAEPVFQISEDRKVVDMTIRLDPQKQYRIREIEFWGVEPELERRLRESYQQSGEIFSKRKMEEFFHNNKAILPTDAQPDEDVGILRDTQAAMIGVLFDFRTCPGQTNH